MELHTATSSPEIFPNTYPLTPTFGGLNRWNRAIGRKSCPETDTDDRLSASFGFPVIGIVGGIGSGKSTVAREAERLRPEIRVLDADRIGHEILTEPHVKTQLQAVFGPEIFEPSGEVSRSALARRVFGTDRQSERKQLEAIVHPEIRRRMLSQLENWSAAGTTAAVLIDAAILLETGWSQLCDKLVFVDVSLEERLRRVREGRGWTPDELARREASQMDLAEKRNLCDTVVSNENNPERAALDLIALVQSLNLD